MVFSIEVQLVVYLVFFFFVHGFPSFVFFN